MSIVPVICNERFALLSSSDMTLIGRRTIRIFFAAKSMKRQTRKFIFCRRLSLSDRNANSRLSHKLKSQLVFKKLFNFAHFSIRLLVQTASDRIL